MTDTESKLWAKAMHALQDAYYWAHHESRHRASCKGCDPSGEGGEIYGELAAEYRAVLKEAGADVDRTAKDAAKLSNMYFRVTGVSDEKAKTE